MTTSKKLTAKEREIRKAVRKLTAHVKTFDWNKRNGCSAIQFSVSLTHNEISVYPLYDRGDGRMDMDESQEYSTERPGDQYEWAWEAAERVYAKFKKVPSTEIASLDRDYRAVEGPWEFLTGKNQI